MMASEDVIELGSSDDEASPMPPRPPGPPKLIPGPRLNAMVHIPKNIRELTIKPTKPTLKTSVPIPVLGVGNIPSSLRPTSKLNNQVTIKPVSTNKQSHSSPKKALAITLPVTKPISGNKALSLNPLSVMRNLDKSQIIINKVKTTAPTNIANIKTPIKVQKLAKKPVGVPKLSPSVTITKTQGGTKRPMISNVMSLKKKQKLNSPPKVTPAVPKPNIKKVIQTVGSSTLAVNPLRVMATVGLNKAAGSTSNTPSWYLRPEEQTNEEAKDLEKQNNAEPEPPKFIEITIEDSPVSKPKNRRASELDNSITIDDSPVRQKTPKKTAADSDSDGQNEKHRTPKKRKKLEYHPMEVPILEKSIEIEIDPVQIELVDDVAKNDGKVDEVNDPTPKTTKDKNMDRVNESVIEIVESPVKKMEIGPASESSKSHTKQKLGQSCDSNKPRTKPKLAQSCDSNKPHTKPKPALSNEPSKTHTKQKLGPSNESSKTHTKQKFKENHESCEPEIVIVEEEFHPVYQKYIDLCFELDSSNDMKIIVEKKIKGYYKQVPKEYTESEEFIDMVSSKMLAMKADKEKMYLYIKDIVDELNVQRKIAKNQQLQKETEKKESGKLTFTDDSEFDSKRQRQIRKLEKTIRKLHRAIQKLEEQEVDFDDEDDSVYLLTERYKERMVRVHAKLCQLTNTKLPSEPRLHIESRPGQPTGPAKRLEKWINKKVPIGKPLPFPDFHDVLRIVREANSEDKLGWNEADVMEEARDLFTRCGKKLQRRRQEIEWRIAASRLPPEEDPAETNDDLKTKLDRNRLMANKKEIDVVNKYAERQSEMKLVGEEIGDKEAEESPVESEDDEVTEEVSALKDKEKRKERLKRLIQEKSDRKSREATVDSQTIQEKTSEKSAEVKEDTHTIEEPQIILDESTDTQRNDVKDPLASTETTEALATDIDDQSKSQPDKINTGHEKKVVEDAEEKDTKTSVEKKDKKTCDPEKKRASKADSEVEINSVDDGSEVDELQLLQKLYSQSENSSSGNSSESDTPIDVSDSVESDGNCNKGTGVISIENSSESDTQDSKSKDGKQAVLCEVIEEIESSQDALEFVVEKEVENLSNVILVDSQKDKDENNDESNVTACEPLTDDKKEIEENTMEVEDCDPQKSRDDKDVNSGSDLINLNSQTHDKDENINESNKTACDPVTEDKIETEKHAMGVKDCDSQKSSNNKDMNSGSDLINMVSQKHDDNDEKNDLDKETAPDATNNDTIEEQAMDVTHCEPPKSSPRKDDTEEDYDLVRADSPNHNKNDVKNYANKITEPDDSIHIEKHRMDLDDCDSQKPFAENDEETLQQAIDSIESVLGPTIKDNVKETLENASNDTEKEQCPLNAESIDEAQTSKSDSSAYNGYTVISEALESSETTNGPNSKETENDDLSNKKETVTADLVEDKMQTNAEAISESVADLVKEKKQSNAEVISDVSVSADSIKEKMQSNAEVIGDVSKEKNDGMCLEDSLLDTIYGK